MPASPSAARGGTLKAPVGRASLPVTGAWRRELARAIRDEGELRRILELPPRPVAAGGGGFPLLVPRGFAALMRRGDPDDPLLRQVLPIDAEERPVPGFGVDPVGESACATAPGLLQKYRGRALLVATGACAVHCRYCFRRHFPYDERPDGREWWRPALARVAEDPECAELILSGGDPLVLADRELADLLAAAGAIPHLRRIRIHTRLPVVLPQRVDDGLLGVLADAGPDVVVVLHANHPREFGPAQAAACAALRGASAALLNQAVLLRGVNDDARVLADLSEAGFAVGVLPYYLHQLDPVAGAAHFAVDDERAVGLYRELAARLPGYLVPRLVRELPGGECKEALLVPSPG